MAPLPPHTSGRPLQPRHGAENLKIRPDTGHQPWKGIPQTVPPQSGIQGHDRFRPYLPHHRPQSATGARKTTDGSHLSMDALEVGVPRPRSEQPSHDTAQQALAAMRRDEYLYASNEHQDQRQRRDSLLMESASVKKSSPKKRSNLVLRDVKPPPQSLAATHPSIYQQPPHKAVSTMPPPPLPRKASRAHAHQEVEPPVNPWQIYSDPKHLTSTSPLCDDPRFRMLKTDVDPEKPNVISPVFLIALPFGTLIEGACHYPEEADRE